jgi:hypothetical protein
MLMWLVIIGNILGALMVAMHKSMLANKIWFITNPILIAYNTYIGSMEQAVMFSVYWILCILGIAEIIGKEDKNNIKG